MNHVGLQDGLNGRGRFATVGADAMCSASTFAQPLGFGFQVSAPPLADGASRLTEKVTLGLLRLFFHSMLDVGRSMLGVHLLESFIRGVSGYVFRSSVGSLNPIFRA